ncbi:invasion protein IalB [Natronobacillus azotifigens]|uniref:DUF3006 domain-containing protein n=1 Tax=Natronobacillus azotifigens TaxID=472978 RepID=A0A9J6RGI1_9BACI|nr:DUF3006 domain-containing protein [Natronobacillus azotifigens]MCZ0704435.1 DUF3006 domain-containing protein [Natronobacillus azotifigens]
MILYQAVFDRISDNNKAVLLVEGLNQEYVIDLLLLPSGAKPNDWFEIDIENNRIVEMRFDSQKTDETKHKINKQMNRIRTLKKGSKFKRK